MLRNYLTIALRNLRRNAGYTAINLIGLAVGLAACILIGLYVRHELSYDDFHEKSGRIYRLVRHHQQGEQSGSTLEQAAPLGPAIEAKFPSVEQTVRLYSGFENHRVQQGEHTFYEDDFYFAGSTFFDVFAGFDLRQGNLETVLSEPFSVVLSKRAAEKYFGGANPVGKTIQAEFINEMQLTVTGVAENPPPLTPTCSSIFWCRSARCTRRCSTQ